MSENKTSNSKNYEIILFFNSKESLLTKIKSPLTYEGKNQFFQELLLKNSLHLSSECDSYRNFMINTGFELEGFLQSNELSFFESSERPNQCKKIMNYLVFLNNIFLLDENSIDFLNSMKILDLFIELLSKFFQYSIKEKDYIEKEDFDILKEFVSLLFENLNLIIKRNNYAIIETFIEKSYLERLFFLIDFPLIDELVLSTIFSISTACYSKVCLIEFVQKNHVLKLLPQKIQEKNLDFILMSIEMFFMFPFSNSYEQDFDHILTSLKKKVVKEFNNPMINLKELIQQICKYCYKEFKLFEQEKKIIEKSPNKKNKKKQEEIKEEISNKNNIIENVSFIEVN